MMPGKNHERCMLDKYLQRCVRGLFYSETCVVAETPPIGKTSTKWEKSLDRCWPVYHMPNKEAARLGKATEPHRFDCYLLLSCV